MITLSVAGVALFISGRFRADVVGLTLMSALILTGVLTPAEGTSGFANEAALTIAAMFVLSSALVRAGAIDLLARKITRLQRDQAAPRRDGARRPDKRALEQHPGRDGDRVAPDRPQPQHRGQDLRFLMPISFASQLGGRLTLIGSSTNLVAAGVLVELGLPRIDFRFSAAAGGRPGAR
ncbi:MAG TPA: SLC13 family permease [Gemmatimonadaceae bacterium]